MLIYALSDPQGALRLTRNLITKLSAVSVMPSAHPYAGLLRIQQEILIDLLPEEPAQPSKRDLDETIRTVAALTYGLSLMLRPGHPVRAIAYAELGKLLAMDEPEPSHAYAAPTNILSPSSSPFLNPGATDAPITSTGVSLAYPPPYTRPDFPPSGPDRLMVAEQVLRQAHAESRIAFGSENGKEGGEVGVDLRETLVRVEKELAVWKERVQLAMADAMAKARTKAQ